ncbi:hypothetical protein IJT93_06790 [bacterium]|nr:hypothetical protein [bacterium]
MSATNLNLNRLADQINVILTQVFRKYVAQGSPTKLGGLRFLDTDSSKTFAFEKTGIADDGLGNLLLMSAPYANLDQTKEPDQLTDKKVVEAEVVERVTNEVSEILRQGPYGSEVRKLIVRPSKDSGKGDRFFIEAGYYLPTSEMLTDEKILAFAQRHNISSSREAVTRILEEKIVPMADEIMQYLIHHLSSDRH